MKKLIFLLVVVGLLASGAVPAAAQGEPTHGGPGHGGPMHGVGLMGNVVSVNPAAKSFEVKVLSASMALHDKIGQTLVVTTKDTTRFFDRMTPIQFEDILVGDTVSVQGTLNADRTAITADRVTIAAHHHPGGPGRGGPVYGVALMGTVSAVDSQDNTLTIHVQAASSVLRNKIGQDVVVETTDTTRFYEHMTPINFGDIQVGDSVNAQVTVNADHIIAVRVTVMAQVPHSN